MDDVRRLLFEREIALVATRYAHMCDERDWNAMSSVFTADASADYGSWHLPDPAAILHMLTSNLGGCGPTQHLLGNVCVDVDAAGVVTSRIAVRAAHRSAGDMAHETYECFGEYRDRWRETPEGWRIAHRRMVVAFEYGTRKVPRAALL